MSLTITFYNKSRDSLVPYYTRIDGTIVEIDDIDEVGQEVASINITHNLNRMAERISVGPHHTLYDLLWHGNELETPIACGRDFISYLLRVIPYMEDHREDLEKFNPDNGWGNFDGLLQFTEKCLAYAILYPESEVHFSV